MGVLLVRTITGAASPVAYREVIAEQGRRVLRPVVARREVDAQAHGEPIERVEVCPYGDAVGELLTATEVPG